MCGIFASNDPGVRDRVVAPLRNRLAFRGPDWQSPVVEHKGWVLYHSRLSIIAPTEQFSQPYFSRSGGVLLFNGEILNYASLASRYRLQNNGSDTDILAQLLSLAQFDLNELEGFFAFVHINSSGQLTHCARDRFGVKPLVYYSYGDRIAIASEASVLADLYGLQYDQMALSEYRHFRAPIFSGSYFQGITAAEPGSCLITGRYFDPAQYISSKYSRLADVSGEVSDALDASITSRLVSDVPVGLLLSGGVDSNLIRAHSDRRLECLTSGFDGDYDVEYARAVADSDVEIVSVSHECFRSRLEDMVRLRKEPLSVPNEVVLSYLAEAWRNRGGKVLLSGEAADEFFGGYDRIYGWALSSTEFSVDGFLERYSYADSKNISEEIRCLFEDFFASLPGVNAFEMVRQFFLQKHLPILFRRLDFALMFSGVEGREPFASTRMFEVAMKIEPTDLFRGGVGKLPLRDLAADKFGAAFAFAPKVGFPIDVGKVLGGETTGGKFENYDLWFRENMSLIL